MNQEYGYYSNGLIITVSSKGNILNKQRTYSKLFNITQIESGYIIAGQNNFRAPYHDQHQVVMKLLVLNTNGLVRKKLYFDELYDYGYAYSAVETFDKSVFVIGEYKNGITWFKTNQNGKVKSHSSKYSSMTNSKFTTIQTINGNYLVLADTEDYPIMLISDKGQLIWTQELFSGTSGIARGIIEVSDNEFVIADNSQIIKIKIAPIEAQLSIPDRIYVNAIKKNGKPFGQVEIYINNHLIGKTYEVSGKLNSQITESGVTKLRFKKGRKEFTTSVNISKDSIYNIDIKLNKPEYTVFKISSKPLETPMYENYKNTKNTSILNAFIEVFTYLQ